MKHAAIVCTAIALLFSPLLSPTSAQSPSTSGGSVRPDSRSADESELAKLPAATAEKMIKGDYAASLALNLRRLDLVRSLRGESSREYVELLYGVGGNLALLGRYEEAQTYLNRAIQAAATIRLGDDDTLVRMMRTALLSVEQKLGNKSNEEAKLKRRIAEIEAKDGANSRSLLHPFTELGHFYLQHQRLPEAVRMHERALAVAEQRLPEKHIDLHITAHTLGLTYLIAGRADDAERSLRRALELAEKAHGANDWMVLAPISTLTVLLVSQKRFAEYESLKDRSLALTRKRFGSGSGAYASRLMEAAHVSELRGRFAEAETALKEALEIEIRRLGMKGAVAAPQLGQLIALYLRQDDTEKALTLIRRFVSPAIERVRYANLAGRDGSNRAEWDEFAQRQQLMHWLVRAAFRQAEKTKLNLFSLAEEAFVASQWGLTDTVGSAISQMTARFAAGTGALSEMTKARQLAYLQWRSLDQTVTRMAALGEKVRDPAAELEIRNQLNATEKRLSDLDGRLAKAFPEYASLANPEPLGIEATRSLLQDDEVLITFTANAGSAFVWVLGRSTSIWNQIQAADQIERRVHAMRCGLDSSSWDGDGGRHCAQLLPGGTDHAPTDGRPPWFDLGTAHDLYNQLFKNIIQQIRGKKLIIVGSGALTGLPFHTLVSEDPSRLPNDEGGYRAAKWLARQNSITVLPTVASLKALRGVGRRPPARRPYAGFGNPVLKGDKDTDKQAAVVHDCTSPAARPPSRIFATRAKSHPRKNADSFFMEGRAVVSEVLKLEPLPETAHELCSVATLLKADLRDVHLGPALSERNIQGMSKSGRLSAFRVLHFATHGLVAGETVAMARSLAEPALVMTPPETATDDEDGLLTASEVAKLNINADWVILSACNTMAAGGRVVGAEPMSGLARAFFYAGARSILVSHWAVYSEAAVKLVGRTLARAAADPSLDRGEALRQAMLESIERGEPYEAHPAYWAPFVLVGEARH